jgi:hypothetical protein
MVHLDLTMLHRSASIRERTPDDLAGVDTHPFGLQHVTPPRHSRELATIC